QQMTTLERVGFPERYVPLLAAAELAPPAGILTGLPSPPLGVAAAVGLIPYFIGAVGSHLRVRAPRGPAPPPLLPPAVPPRSLRLASACPAGRLRREGRPPGPSGPLPSPTRTTPAGRAATASSSAATKAPPSG